MLTKIGFINAHDGEAYFFNGNSNLNLEPRLITGGYDRFDNENLPTGLTN